MNNFRVCRILQPYTSSFYLIYNGIQYRVLL
nr:MAG TPA: hypothetical protein [Bacteriophage sp.]